MGAWFREGGERVNQQNGGKEGKHLKERIMVDIFHPMLRGKTIKMDGLRKWIKFNYERCPDFCYTCRIVGHNEKACKSKISLENGQQENQCGLWLRVNFRKSSTQKENNNYISSSKR